MSLSTPPGRQELTLQMYSCQSNTWAELTELSKWQSLNSRRGWWRGRKIIWEEKVPFRGSMSLEQGLPWRESWEQGVFAPDCSSWGFPLSSSCNHWPANYPVDYPCFSWWLFFAPKLFVVPYLAYPLWTASFPIGLKIHKCFFTQLGSKIFQE